MIVELDLGSAFSILRGGVAVDATDAATQTLFESWVKRERWRVISEALPLVVGISPSIWPAHVQRVQGALAALQLGLSLARFCKVDSASDPEIPPVQVRRWMAMIGIALPSSLARLFDFLSAVLPRGELDLSSGSSMPSEEFLAMGARCTVLGAALSLLTKRPQQCRDDAGAFDCARIARLIFAQAVVWFPLAPPQISEAEAATLLRRWVASQ